VHSGRPPRLGRAPRPCRHAAGYFTTAQAQGFGFSPENLIHHLKQGRIRRTRRGVYRVRHLPPADDEQLVELWLWSAREGVISHRSALALHELSDVLPTRVDLTLPASWRSRRLRIPEEVVPHYADLSTEDRTWIGHVPVTSPARTVRDCIADHVSPELVDQAVAEGLARGVFTANEIRR
jgi:predicted transcriptional regulator of viral defense system